MLLMRWKPQLRKDILWKITPKNFPMIDVILLQDQKKYVSAFKINLLLQFGCPDQSTRIGKDYVAEIEESFDERLADWHKYLLWIIKSIWNIYDREAQPCLQRIMWLLRLDSGQWSRTQMETPLNVTITINQWHLSVQTHFLIWHYNNII